MMPAFFFLLIRSWKNRVFSRFRRLRNPRYLISALAGLAYLYFAFVHEPFIHRSEIPRETLPVDPGVRFFVETLFACMLLAVVLFQWFFSSTRTQLFNEAEVQFLFPAPVSRGALLNYRIGKAQIGVLFGTLISFIVFGRGRFFPHAVFALFTIWGVYSIVYLYRVAVLLGKQSLERQGAKGRQRKAWVLAVVLIAAIFVLASARRFCTPPPAAGHLTPENLFSWLKLVAESGPVFYVLSPFRLLVQPAFATGLSDFIRRFIPLVLVIAAIYAWIRRTNAGFEEAALGQSPGGEIPASDSGSGTRRVIIRKPRRPPFRLTPQGSAPIAIYWKNLSLAGGLSLRQTIPALAALSIFAILIAPLSGEQAPMIIGSACASLAGILTLMGPIIFRDDLRTDLKNIDLLKAYPVPGWGIVLGEVLGPATVLSILQWLLVLLAAGVLPSLEGHPWSVSHRIYIALAAALLLPCLSFIGILVQNAAVLLLPGWIHVGREHQRGVEAMGQRLISGIATLISLVIAAIPSSVLFVLMWLAGYWLIGLAIVPIAAFVAAFGLLVESVIGILLLGRLFEKFDPAKELG